MQQQKILRELRRNKKLIVTPSDKNLGPVLMERDEYIKAALREHLGNAETYQRLTPAEFANETTYVITRKLSKWHNKHNKSIAEGELIFLRRCKNKATRKCSRFYLTIKMHKQPWKMRPVVSTCGTYLHSLSRWADFHLQQLTSLVPTYLRDSHQLIDDLHQMDTLPVTAKLFTADAVSMYTNIDSTHALQVLQNLLDENKNLLPENFPTNALLDALQIIMDNNVFEFGSEHFKQRMGTAMGTPVACIYATMYYGLHERKLLLEKYKDDVIFRKPFIDDMFRIWTGTAERFEAFKRDLPFGQLQWDATSLKKSVDFLDLTITIEDDGKISTKTFQKAMNLHLYIPATSAHRTGMIKGIINSLIHRFYKQNSMRKDFIYVTTLLYQCLIARGWDKQWMKHLIMVAVDRIQYQEQHPQPAPKTLQPKNSVFLHLQYHPNDIPRTELRALFRKNCTALEEMTTENDKPFAISSLIIAYSRAKNLRDVLTSAKLHEVSGNKVSQYF